MFNNNLSALTQRDDHWISAADLLGGALILFFLLMLYFMLTQQEESAAHEQAWKETVQSLQTKLRGAQMNVDSVKEVAVYYDKKRDELFHELVLEFGEDLPKWNAEIDDDLTVRFNEPDVLFATGSATIREDFRDILNDFFPRYMKVMTQEGFVDSIAELRIEGHTSSFWNRRNPASTLTAYLKNMDLSYARSRSVLRYVMLDLNKLDEHRTWLREHLTANGMSSSKLVYNADGSENSARSQRVEFRVRTDIDSRMAKILELSN
ncbi:MAG: OmpA/MotB family protein [Oceanococcus sp.]